MEKITIDWLTEEYLKGAKKNGELLNEVFYRPLAFPFMMVAKWLKLTPNFISLIGFLITIATAVLIGFNQLILAGIFVFLRHLLDNVDGSLARNTKQFSKFGAIFDAFCDTVGFVFIVFGLMARYWIFEDKTFWFGILFGIIIGASLGNNVMCYDSFRARYVLQLDDYGNHQFELFSGPKEEKKFNKWNPLGYIITFFEKFYIAIGPIPELKIPVELPQEDKVKIRTNYNKIFKQTFSISHKLWSLSGGTVINSLFIIFLLMKRVDLIFFSIVYVLGGIILLNIAIQNISAIVFRRKVRDMFGMNVTEMINPFTGKSIPI